MISLTFDRRSCPNHCRRLTCKSERFIRRERSEFHLLSSMGLSKSFSTVDLQKTDLFDEGETNEFHSLSINEIDYPGHYR
jgi:hypothetical protein